MRGVRCPVVVGREQELGLLTDVVVGAIGGRGGAAFVLGEPGIGKSRLLAAVADIARSRDMAVLRGRAAPSPAPAPYRPLAEAFLSALRGRDIDDDRDLGRFRGALPVLVPGWGAADSDAEPSIVLLGEATMALAQRCSGSAGVLLVLEDLHWADAETWELIDYLSDKLDSTSIALLASIRTGESTEAERLAHTVTARRHAASVMLHRLDADHVEAVIGASLGTTAVPESLRRAVAAASGGVPLLVEEFLASLVEARALWREGDGWGVTDRLPALVPPSFAALISDRLAALSEAGRRVLDAAAVIGEQIEPRLLASVTGLDEATTIDGIREAVRAQVVDEVSTGPPIAFRFHHGLSRAAVLDRMQEPERRQVATRALACLEADGSAADVDRLSVLASLALSAGDTPRAVRALIEAAVAALRHGACVSARHAAERAADLATSAEERAEAHEVLLNACAAAGDAARAFEVGQELVADLARLDADPLRRCEVHIRLAEAAVSATDCPRADRHLEEAMLLAGNRSGDVGARVELVRASIALCRHLPHQAAAHAVSAMAEATDTDDPIRLAEAATLLGRAHRVTDLEAARRAFSDALDAAHRVGDHLLVAKAAHELATLDVLEAGPLEPMQEARRLAHDAGALALVAACDAHLSILHWLRFDLDATRVTARRALDAATRYHLGLLAPSAAVMVAGADAVLGRRIEATEMFDRFSPMMDEEIEATGRGHVLALSALACEDRPGALEQFERAAVLAPPYSDVARAPHCGMRALLLATERSAAAAAVSSTLDNDPAIAGVPRAFIDLALAVVQGRRGDGVGAGALAKDALDALQRTPWFRAMGARLVAEAAIECGWGRPTDWLREAHDFFDTAGITEPAHACRQLLRRAGAPAPRQPSNGQHPELARLGITPRESEVLLLVAAGRSNRDVAEQLVLSVRTVEKHVERLMVKTSTANRTQLAALASRLAGPAAATT